MLGPARRHLRETAQRQARTQRQAQHPLHAAQHRALEAARHLQGGGSPSQSAQRQLGQGPLPTHGRIHLKWKWCLQTVVRNASLEGKIDSRHTAQDLAPSSSFVSFIFRAKCATDTVTWWNLSIESCVRTPTRPHGNVSSTRKGAGKLSDLSLRTSLPLH